MEGLHFRKKEIIKNPEEETEFLDEEGELFFTRDLCLVTKLIIIIIERARKAIAGAS